MAHRKTSRSRLAGHRHTGVAASLSGDTHAPTLLHSVETRPPVREGSIWGRRRVLLLNSTYEPLTALPMRRAVVMLMCGKADRMLAELGWTLRLTPTRPKGQHWRLLSTVKELDPAWMRYLGEGAA